MFRNESTKRLRRTDFIKSPLESNTSVGTKLRIQRKFFTPPQAFDLS